MPGISPVSMGPKDTGRSESMAIYTTHTVWRSFLWKGLYRFASITSMATGRTIDGLICGQHQPARTQPARCFLPISCPVVIPSYEHDFRTRAANPVFRCLAAMFAGWFGVRSSGNALLQNAQTNLVFGLRKRDLRCEDKRVGDPHYAGRPPSCHVRNFRFTQTLRRDHHGTAR